MSMKKIQPEQTLSPNPWLERVGFARHLKGLPVQEVINLALDIASPEHSNAVMQQIALTLEFIVRFAQRIVLHKVNIGARFLLHRRDFNQPVCSSSVSSTR